MAQHSTTNRIKLAMAIVAGLVGLEILSGNGLTIIQRAVIHREDVAPVATDAMGIPIAPFSLGEPPVPISESASEQSQLASLYQQVQSSTRGGAMYNLACEYSVMGEVDAAIYWLQRAAREEGVELESATNDADLAAVRDDRRGPRLFSYLTRMASYHENHPLDRQTLSLPRSYQVGKPIPMLIGLHGLGSVPEGFGDDFRELADTLGIALLAVSATKTVGPKSFVWREDVEADAKRIQSAIAAVSDKVTLANGQVYLIGFSQGGQLALEIAAKHSEIFGGAIAMSPGTHTAMERIGFGATMLPGRRFVIVAGEEEHPETLATARISKERLLHFGAKVFYRTYPNVATHSFPADYYEMLPRWLAFLQGGASPDADEHRTAHSLGQP